VLEITETDLMDVEVSGLALGKMQDLGVHVAVDDFGTGWSSLRYLRQFPVDVLKIDRSFVAGLGRDTEDEAIVAAVVDLAHALGLSAVAEGVEEQVQLDRLWALGCDSAQGWLLGMPMAEADLLEVLEAQT
jgi:EAL domain-containing protein (putative c-di-GMP-specific phosphodiesterase class I)